MKQKTENMKSKYIKPRSRVIAADCGGSLCNNSFGVAVGKKPAYAGEDRGELMDNY